MGGLVILLTATLACTITELAAQYLPTHPDATPWLSVGPYSPGLTSHSQGPPQYYDSLYHRSLKNDARGDRDYHVPSIATPNTAGYAVHEPPVPPSTNLHSLLHGSHLSAYSSTHPPNLPFVPPPPRHNPSNVSPPPIATNTPPSCPYHPPPNLESLLSRFSTPSSLQELLNTPYFRGPVSSPGYYSPAHFQSLPSFNFGYPTAIGSHLPQGNKPPTLQ